MYLSRVKCDRAQDLIGRGEDWRRPTRAQPVTQGKISKVRPEWIGFDVAHLHRLAPKCSCATGANGGSNLDAVYSTVVGLRQVRGGLMVKASGVLIHLQN